VITALCCHSPPMDPLRRDAIGSARYGMTVCLSPAKQPQIVFGAVGVDVPARLREPSWPWKSISIVVLPGVYPVPPAVGVGGLSPAERRGVSGRDTTIR